MRIKRIRRYFNIFLKELFIWDLREISFYKDRSTNNKWVRNQWDRTFRQELQFYLWNKKVNIKHNLWMIFKR